MAEETSALDFEMPIVELESKISEIRNLNQSETVNLDQEIKALEEKRDSLIREIFSALTPWQKVQLARHPRRPRTLEYITAIFTDFSELHGDRFFSDDAALLGGTAFLGEQAVIVMGHQKGRSIEESMMRNFGMMHPEGYRKALRLFKLAEKFGLPVITFIDTPGAYPGIGAEERGQAQAIAINLKEMSILKVPILGIVIGEGGSGGALGIGVTDRVLMLENSWYSVISPEGCAAILFHDAARAPDAAKVLKLTAQDLLEFKIIDEVIPEPPGGAHRSSAAVFEKVSEALKAHLSQLRDIPVATLVDMRYEKYRKIGFWTEAQAAAAFAAPKRVRKKKDPISNTRKQEGK